MKLRRLLDNAVFDAIGVPEDRTLPVVPCCLIGQIEAVDDVTGALWIYTDDGRQAAEAGDAIVHDGVRIVALLKAAAGKPKGWAPVKDVPPAV